MLFEQIKSNKRNTWILFICFAIILLAVAVFITDYLGEYFGVGFVCWGVCYVAYLYFDAASHLMKITGGAQVTKNDVPVLFESIEELCIAGNLPHPTVYVIPTDDINAFATGSSPEKASLAVTTGLLDQLDKKEIEGVVGHELSHIKNYDIRFTTLASAIAALLVKTTFIFLGIGVWLFNIRGTIGLVCKLISAMFFLVGAGIGLVAVPGAKLLTLMVSRQREYLADAGSCDLTREPSGLISALTKLKQMDDQLKQVPPADRNAMVTDDPMVAALAFSIHPKNWIGNLLADHPPLEKRIDRLEKSAALGKTFKNQPQK